jgi:DnaJ-class molecular chaperone
MPSYYKILNIEEDCSHEDIVKAYKTLAMKYHPDRGGTGEQFKSISEAYEILTDKGKREEYDNHILDEMYLNYADPEIVFNMIMNRSDEEAFREFVGKYPLFNDWNIKDSVETSHILKSLKN